LHETALSGLHIHARHDVLGLKQIGVLRLHLDKSKWCAGSLHGGLKTRISSHLVILANFFSFFSSLHSFVCTIKRLTACLSVLLFKFLLHLVLTGLDFRIDTNSFRGLHCFVVLDLLG